MALAKNRQTNIYFETFGSPEAPAVLLLGGTGRQAIDYDEEFCGALVTAGFRAIRFDSRDVGMSSAFIDVPANLAAVYHAALAGGTAEQAYRLADMAQDALAVLDAAGIESAHFVGRSLGGAVAQFAAVEAQDRVLSLCLIMTNARSIASDITPDMIVRVEGEKLTNVDDYTDRQIRAARANALPQDFDKERIAREARLAWDRGVHAGAIARHFAVAIGMPDLRGRISRLTIPTLVIHGAQDRTIKPIYASEIAAAIPNAKLLLLQDMGHDGAPRVRRSWIPAIVENLRLTS